MLSMEKTKKNKNNNISSADKAKLWNIFDSEIVNEEKEKVRLECISNKISIRDSCEMCNSLLILSEEGFPTCGNEKCGIIYKDILDHSPEWRYYGADDNQASDPTRCGMPINPLLEESSYGCKVIACGPMSYQMRKIRRYTEWQSTLYKEKALYEDFKYITNMCEIIGLPKLIVDYAMLYHKKISEYDQTFRGENKDGILLASIHIACRINNYPRTIKELAVAFHLDITSATQACKNAQIILNHLEKDLDVSEKTNFGKTTPESFIDRYCSELNINNELTKLCKFICVKIEKDKLMPENTPQSIAAGVVYFISQLCNLNVSKKSVHGVSKISEVTINKCYKKIEEFKERIVPAVIMKKYVIK